MFTCPHCRGPCVVETGRDGFWQSVTCAVCNFFGMYNRRIGWRYARPRVDRK